MVTGCAPPGDLAGVDLEFSLSLRERGGHSAWERLLALEAMLDRLASGEAAAAGSCLEPGRLERKSGRQPAQGAPEGRSDPRETLRMLKRMRKVLASELDRFGSGDNDGDPAEAGGKAAVDLMSLIVRTLEKIDQMERAVADEEAEAAATGISDAQREKLKQTVRDLVRRLAETHGAEHPGGDGRSGDEPGGM